jgi:hypothetical protein
MLTDVLVVDVDETAGELPVVVDQPVTNPENIHVTPGAVRPQTFRWPSMRRPQSSKAADGQHSLLDQVISGGQPNPYIQTLQGRISVTCDLPGSIGYRI